MKKEEPLRVAQVIGKWLGGGVEAVIMNYYRHIDRSKIQFDFICDSDSTNIPYDEIKSLGGRVILVPPYQKLFKYEKELIKIFRENEYKIVHSNINALSVFSLRAAKKAGVPIRISHSHSTSNKKEWKKNFVKNLLRPFSKVYATDYFACSEHAGRWLFGDKIFDDGKVIIINNAIDIDKFKFSKEVRKKKREELKINDSTLVVGHIGRFVTQKNHIFLIDIFNELLKEKKDSLLLLVGQGPKEQEIKNKVKQMGIEEKTIFLGQREDVGELYQVMDVFLFPSLYEGLGMVLIEAQCSGLPCITSTEVPSVVKVTSKLDFLDLLYSANQWASQILKHYDSKRDFSDDKLLKSGFNISFEAKKIEKYYLSR